MRAIAPAFLISVVGSLIVGLVLAWLVGQITRRIADVPSSIVFQFVSTFSVWVIAERIALSPILVTVIYAMTLARSRLAYPPRACVFRPTRSGRRRSSFWTCSRSC
jgi:monovalent cation/hydrogen antiporter